LVYGIFDALFVEICPACGGSSRAGFCAVCAAELRRVRSPCRRCGLAQPVDHCPRLRSAWHVDSVLAPFLYAPPLDHYLQAFKYRGARALGRAFGLLVCAALEALPADVDALVAVPLHPARLRERGYNQALEVARTLARRLRMPLLEHGVARHAATPTQTSRTALERRAAMADAFTVRRDVRGRSIAIVDDVVTTGATVNALAAALRSAGARRCIALAVARTPERPAAPPQGRNV
jgi:ComF family protein